MLISSNILAKDEEFRLLLDRSLEALRNESKKYPEKYLKLLGPKLEHEVFDIMTSCAVDTSFERTIELVSGQKFPDIIAANFFGVEVKSTKQNHWRSTGNSVLESTRVEYIEKIYMLFGKMYQPIDFKYRPYEACLSNVIVTHSPRYAIDMNLAEGATVFDKIAITYDEIRKQENPIKSFKDYYRSKLKEGQELWWIDNDEDQTEQIIFNVWNTLDRKRKDKLKIKGFVLFPEILSKMQTKYDRFTLWLSLQEKVLCPNVRDVYTAGGRGNLTIEGIELLNLPKVLFKFINNIDSIVEAFHKTPISEFGEIWKSKIVDKATLKNYWITSIVQAADEIYDFKDFNFQKWLSIKLN